EDLSLVIATLLERSNAEVSFTIDAARFLYEHTWPLNVRELEQTLAAACARAGANQRVELAHLQRALSPAPSPLVAEPGNPDIRAAVEAALEQHHGNIAAVARALGKDRTQIRRWMRRYGLRRPVTPDDRER